jgi:hypothetical protein
MLPFFQNIVGFLNEEEIPYMLTGSVAMSIYIVPRATKDLDFVVALQTGDIDKIVQRFQHQYYCDKESMADALRRQLLFNIIDPSTGFKADFIPLKATSFEQTKFNRRRETDFLGSVVYVISPEDLILSKLVWIQQLQSTQQMIDIENLLEIESLDRDYISYWIKEINLATFDLI